VHGGTCCNIRDRTFTEHSADKTVFLEMLKNMNASTRDKRNLKVDGSVVAREDDELQRHIDY
jgi:hypothetical protein